MMHGAALVIHRIWSRFLGFAMPRIPARILTFFFVLLAWVPFRAVSWKQAMGIYKGMFAPADWNLPAISGADCWLFAAGIVLIVFFPPVCELEKRFRPTWCNALIAAGLIVVSMFYFVKYSPFIYFNF